jgi:hypothetical protein
MCYETDSVRFPPQAFHPAIFSSPNVMVAVCCRALLPQSWRVMSLLPLLWSTGGSVAGTACCSP